MEKRYCSKNEAREILGISMVTLDKLLKSKKIKAIKLDRRVLIPIEALDPEQLSDSTEMLFSKQLSTTIRAN